VLGVAAAGWIVGHEQAHPLAQRSAAAAEVRLAEFDADLQLLDGAGQPLAAGTPLAAGASLLTRQGSALLAFPSGAEARVARLTQLRVRAAGAELFLARGQVDVEVPRLTEPVEFSVQTPDALVVVHGTHFSVRVDPDAHAGAVTHVAVSRGLVAVEAGGEQSWLHAGDEWPPAATPQPAGQTRTAPVEPHLAEPAPGVEAPRPVRSNAGFRQQTRLDQHSLATENRVFAAAMARRKAGDLAGALQEIEHLLARYPRSVLVQEARVEQFRLLHGLGRFAEAARQARSYLGDYHDGYAREEAREVALDEPGGGD
jgi:hypothetical protein